MRPRKVFFSAVVLLSMALFWSPDEGLAQSVKYQVEFDWEPVEEASGYELEFKNKSLGGRVTKIKTKSAEFSEGLVAGAYQMRIRSLDSRGVPGEWSGYSEMSVLPPGPEILKPGKKVISKSIDTADVEFSWKKTPGVASYLIRVGSTSSDFKIEEEVKGLSIKLKLPVGEKLSWQVFSQVPGVESSELSAKINQLKHIGLTGAPKVFAPTNEFVESVDWEKVESASKYKYGLYRKVGGKWKRVKRAKTRKFRAKIPRKLPGGDYKLKVAAVGKYRKYSKPTSVEFYMAPERGPAAVKQAKLKESVERPSLFHATGSYIVTNLNYSASNPERNTQSGFSALGGSGRLGFGYTPKGTNWGGIGFAEFSGFTVNSQVFTYFTMEAHATWRKTFGAKVLKITGGGFIRELPEALSSVVDTSQELQLEKVRFMGPAMGVNFAIPFTRKLGLQMNTQLYYSLVSMGTPNNEPVNGALSYQVSFLGSYRIGRNLTALLGYAYKKDSVSYNALSSEESTNSFADAGAINSIDLNGHYLNLMMEWGF